MSICPLKKKHVTRGFPGGPVAKILHSQGSGGPGTIPGQGTRFLGPQLKILHAAKKRSKGPRAAA